MAETAEALHVAFLGTKLPADQLVNLHWRLRPVWPGSDARAHAGYLQRASSMPVDQFQSMAQTAGKRLVLSGARGTPEGRVFLGV